MASGPSTWRHALSFPREKVDANVYIRAVCACGNFEGPQRMFLNQAEEDGYQHMQSHPTGVGRKR